MRGVELFGGGGGDGGGGTVIRRRREQRARDMDVVAGLRITRRVPRATPASPLVSRCPVRWASAAGGTRGPRRGGLGLIPVLL